MTSVSRDNSGAATFRGAMGRRGLLLMGVAGGVVAALGTPLSALANGAAYEEFMAVSAVLTGVAGLSPTLGRAIWSRLAEIDAQATPHAIALAKIVDAHGSLELDALTPDLQAFARSIVSSWYLGVVGKGSAAHVVAYENALMYAPLADVCVLPTFARGEPHYWAKPPVITASKI